MSEQDLIAIVGPTASGKSDLAVLLSTQFGGEVISADSRQVYTWMDIGTGKITEEEMQGIPHHLLNVADPNEQFTVVQYKKLATRAINDIHERGKLPFLVGGTGLYIQAVVDDLSFPRVPPNDALRDTLRKSSVEELFAQLQAQDPNRAETIDPHNKRRLIRALEIIKATGKPVPAPATSSPYNLLMLGIALPADSLHERIEARLRNRLRKDMVEEVQRLHKEHDVSWERLDELGLEYRWVAQFLQKELSHEEMEQKLLQEIQKYAKRQMTWFKRDARIHWLTATGSSEALNTEAIALVHAFLKIR